MEAWLLSENEREQRHARAVLEGKLVALPPVEPPVPVLAPNGTAPNPVPIPAPQVIEPRSFPSPARPHRQIDPHTIITAERLATDTIALVAELPPDVDLVCAVSRSGLMPGGLIASMLHLPIWTVSARHGLADPGHGGRLAPDFSNPASVLPPASPHHVLLIDDTAALGREMRECPRFITERWLGVKITRAAVYCHPQSIAQVDLCFAIYPGMHYLSWNWPNSGQGELCGYDFDGILCVDATIEQCSSEDAYREFIKTARPLYLPRRKPVPMIVSARPESVRQLTMEWLERHGVRCGQVMLRDWDASLLHPPEQQIAEFKAACYATSPCTLFAESSPVQAEIINRMTGKRVICPALGRVLPAIVDPNALRGGCCH